MSKLIKFEGYILDINDRYRDIDEILDVINNKCDAEIISFKNQQSNFEWNDDLKINFTYAKQKDYEKYFK